MVYTGTGGEGRLSNGTHAAELERLVEEYQTAVLRICYLYLCDRSQAEDAVQETFLKVYKGLDSFRGESSETNISLSYILKSWYGIQSTFFMFGYLDLSLWTAKAELMSKAP